MHTAVELVTSASDSCLRLDKRCVHDALREADGEVVEISEGGPPNRRARFHPAAWPSFVHEYDAREADPVVQLQHFCDFDGVNQLLLGLRWRFDVVLRHSLPRCLLLRCLHCSLSTGWILRCLNR